MQEPQRRKNILLKIYVPIVDEIIESYLAVVTDLCLYVAICGVAGGFLAEGTLHPRRRVLSRSDVVRIQSIAASDQADLTDINIFGVDQVPVTAWNLKPQKIKYNGNAVILFHGLSDNRAGMIGYAQIFLKHGHDVLMPDARAHGSSGGQIATYGLKETGDIQNWLDWLEVHEHSACVMGSLNRWVQRACSNR